MAISDAAVHRDVDEGLSGSDSDLSDDGGPEIFTLADVAKTYSTTLRLGHGYARHWTARDAFREFIQNWRDAIIKSFNLAPEQFKVTRTETKERTALQILYTANHNGECLGYIRFSSAKGGAGTIEITNRNAKLELKHLDFNPTGKEKNEDLAGEHGDGMKVGLVVFMREPQSHIVKFCASGFSWNYNWEKRSGRLAVKLARMSDKQRQRARGRATKEHAGGRVPFAADPSRDVQILIGANGTKNDEHGMLKKRALVPTHSFREWCKVAVWLQPYEEADAVQTPLGTLFLNKLDGNVYLKGLLVIEAKKQGQMVKPFRFGYDIRHGHVGRDRHVFSSTKAALQARLDIWNEVVRKAPEHAKKLSELLLSSEEEGLRDIAGFQALEAGLSEQTVRTLWAHLREQNMWYYDREQIYKNPHLHEIIHVLGYPGLELPQPYWDLLAESTNIKTAEEEQENQFYNSIQVNMPSDSDFAWSVVRVTEACLAICEYTKGCGVQIVSAGNLLLSLKYDEVEGHFMIHERHTIKDYCTCDLGLSENASDGTVLFHTVKLLFEEALRQRLAAKSKVLMARGKKREQALVEQELLTYCHLKDSLVLSAAEKYSCAIQVKWASSIARHYRGQAALELHPVSTCSRIKNQRLKKFLPAECDCRKVPLDCTSSSHIFKDLVPSQAYFAVLYDADALDGFLVASEECNPSPHVASRPSAGCPSAATKSTPAARQSSDYSVGPEIPDISMTRMDDRTWYKAVGGGGEGWQDTVIGKKRRRIGN